MKARGRGRAGRRTAAFVCAAALAFGAVVVVGGGVARADVVYFTDGSAPLEGRVLRENDAVVIVEVANGRLTFDRSDIERIERRPWEPPRKPEPGAPAEKPAEAKPAPAAAAPAPAGEGAKAPAAPAGSAEADAAARQREEEAKKADQAARRAAAAEKVKEIAPGLSARSPDSVAETIQRLTALGPDAVPAIAGLVRRLDLPAGVRIALLQQIVSRSSDPEILPALMAVAGEEHDPALVNEAIVTIGALGTEAAAAKDLLLRLARNAWDPSTRTCATTALGHLGDQDAIAQLADRLMNEDAEVRRAIVGALTTNAVATEGILGSLRLCATAGASPGARRDALEALAALDPNARTFRALASDPAPEVRVVALRLLGRLRDGDSFDLLLGSLRDRDEAIVAAAASALAQRPDPRAILPLIDALRRGGTAGTEAHRALGAITGKALPATSLAWRRWWYEGGAKERFGGGL